MFCVGDKILYGGSGACVIEKIEMIRFGRSREKYYVLRSLFQNNAVIYVPVNNADLVSKMREMPSKDDVDRLIEWMPDADSVWIDDAQARKTCFEQIMRSGTCSDRICLIRTLFLHKRSRLSEGKNLHVSDENFLRDAKKLLCDEFAYPLQLEPSQVLDYMRMKLGLTSKP